MREGSRGGNVHSLTTAKQLHSAHKPELTELVTDTILRTLLKQDTVHGDDLAGLDLPAEHLNLVGTSFARLVNKGVIERVGERTSRNKASNGRRSGIYAFTDRSKRAMSGRRGTSPVGAPAPSQRGAGVPRSLPGAPRGSLALDPPRTPQEAAQREDALLGACQEAVDRGEAVWADEWVQGVLG